ncbi:MAG: DUF2490 domain-containing protein [Bacteroidales bacterium]|nr:DUF2490 domain-containing protein [Bacteroidales bacterium]MBR4741043.1 DUF2490 domain-containing protein [Bacteroidales bacterium]
MKKLVLTLALLVPLAAAAQTEFGGGTRFSVAADYKIRKGLHVNVEEEVRVGGVFQSLDRLQTTVGVEYKPFKYMKLGVGYTLINPYDGTERTFKPARHRAFLDVSGHYTWNNFSFSLKERVQYTHRTGTFNVYQNTPDAFAIKSRIGVEYKGWTYFEPGVFFEVRTQLNGPWGETSGSIKAKDDGTTYYAYTPTGYSHVYNDRYRLIFRTDILLSDHHVLKPYALIDFYSPYVIDTNREGTRLFGASYQDQMNVTVGISYTFKF